MKRSIRNLLKFKTQSNRIYIVPTRFGYFFTFIVISLLLTSASIGSEKGNIIVVIMVTIGLMSMFMTNSNLDKVSASLGTEPFQPEHQEGRIHINLHNEGNAEKFSLQSSCPDLCREFTHLTSSLDVNETVTLDLQSQPLDCGIISIDRIKVSTRYPLGLFNAWKWIDIEGSIVSYPKPIGIHWNTFSGNDKGKHKGSSKDDFDFAGHKKYSNGDNLKRIDWKAHARGRPLLVKEFNDGGGSEYLFRLSDISYGNLREKLSQMSFWIHEAHAQGAKYGIETNLGKRAVSSGESHFYLCLKDITRHV